MKYIIACFAMLICLPVFAEEKSDAVKVGIIADLSGHGSNWGRQTALGARLAEHELKASGKNVTVVIGDSAFKTTNGISEAQKMLSLDNVDAVFAEFSPIIAAVSPTVKNANKLFYGSGAGAAFLTTNTGAYKSFMDYAKTCRESAQILKDKGVKNLALLKWPFESGELCKDGVKAVYGDFLDLTFNPGEALSSYALKMKSSKVDGIMFVGLEPDNLNLAKALSEIKYAPYIVNQADNVNATKHTDNYKSIIDGIITYGFIEPSEDFSKRLVALEPNYSPTDRAAAVLSYLAVTHIYDAVTSCPKDDLNCQVQKMSESKPNELLGFQGYKNRIADFTYQYVSWKGGVAQVVK